MMPLDTTLREVRLAIRQVIRTPAISAAAILALALGIGANTAIFSLFDAIVFRALPVDRPDRLVLLGSVGPNGSRPQFSYPAYAHLHANAAGAANLFAHGGLGTVDVSIAGTPAPAIRDVAMVSGNYFSALGVAPVIGRAMLPDDGQASADSHIAVISHRLWEQRFARADDAIGRALTLNGATFTIVGVAPPAFFGTSVGDIVDIWIPLTALPAVVSAPPVPGRPSLLVDVNAGWLTVMGRLEPGVTPQVARRDLDVAFSRFQLQTFGPQARNRPDLAAQRIEIHDGARGVSWLREEFSAALTMLMCVVGAVLLIACANVANLFIGRAVSRQREIAIRQALGASRRHLLRQLFTESLVVAALGGAVGLILAQWSWGALLAMLSPGRAFAPVDVRLDFRLLAFTAVTSIAAAVFCGLAPAWQTRRQSPIATLKDDGSGEGWSPARGSRTGLAVKGLLIAQIALSAFLLVSAGQLVRSFRNLTSLPAGFAVSNQIVLQIDANRAGVAPDGLRPLFEQLRDRLASLPGVQSVAISDTGFFSGSQTHVDVSSADADAPRVDKSAVRMRVAPDYFRTLGLNLRAGRDFTARDTAASPPVAIVNETLARRAFGDRDPIGALLTLGTSTTRVQVIGVARDTRYRSLRRDAPSIVYMPLWQSTDPSSTSMFTVRLEGDRQRPAAAFAAQWQREVHAVSPRLVVAELSRMTDLIDRTLTTDRLVATMSGAFGLLALLMAACGLYAVMSTAVARRTREIGIRAALGADPARLARSVIGEALGTVCAGVIVGLLAAAAAANLIAHFVFELDARDPATFAATAVMLVAAGGLASYLPARRAARVDPLTAIRCD